MSAVGLCRLHDRADVVDPFLEGRDPSRPVGHAGAALVEEDDPRELRHSVEHPGELRHVGPELLMRQAAGTPDHVRAGAPDGVRDVDVPALRVEHGGRHGVKD
jgi:hypothetical protein